MEAFFRPIESRKMNDIDEFSSSLLQDTAYWLDIILSASSKTIFNPLGCQLRIKTHEEESMPILFSGNTSSSGFESIFLGTPIKYQN